MQCCVKSACLDVHNVSFESWCNYDEIYPDTSFMNGYQSLIDVWKSFLDKKKVPILTNAVVNKISWRNENGSVTVSTADGKSFEADHVIVTVSLGNFYDHRHISLKVPNVEFDYDVSVRHCLLSTHTLKLYSTLGTHLHTMKRTHHFDFEIRC